MEQTKDYIGDELALFEKAHNWKRYYSSFFKRYLVGDILEVGAGLGGTTKLLCDGTQESWICLEPDHKLADQIEARLKKKELPDICKVKRATLDYFPTNKKYDAILYIDVIEHIEDDKAELIRAMNLLKPTGHLIILVPAHNWLYSPFDKAIGHFRRYDKPMLKAAIPEDADQVSLKYLDSFGLFASMSNKLLLSQAYPTIGQIRFWDNWMVPVSRWTDFLTIHKIGKSLLGVWKLKAKA